LSQPPRIIVGHFSGAKTSDRIKSFLSSKKTLPCLVLLPEATQQGETTMADGNTNPGISPFSSIPAVALSPAEAREAPKTGGSQKKRSFNSSLIKFAWGIEIVGVSCGSVNAAYTTFGSNFPITFVGWLPAIPLAAIAATELLRVPFAQACIHKASIFVKALALVSLVGLSGLALENWIFGLERVVSIRLNNVTAARTEHIEAQSTYDQLINSDQRTASAGQEKKNEFDSRIGGLERQIKSTELSIAKADEAYRSNLQSIRETCLKTPMGDNCARDRSRDEDARYRSEKDRLMGQRDSLLHKLDAAHQQQQKSSVGSDQTAASITAAIQVAEQRLSEADMGLIHATESNQIYRLASMWFRVPPEKVSPEQFSAARWFFCVFGASLIAFAGSAAALIGSTRESSDKAGSTFGRRIYRALHVLVRRKPKVKVVVKTEEKVKTEYVDRELVKVIGVPVDPNSGQVVAPGKNGGLAVLDTPDFRRELKAA
jgi:hypothetical protein